MEVFSALLTRCEGIPSQRTVTRSFEHVEVFFWYAPEQTVEETLETPVIRDAITLTMTSL